MNFGGEHSAHGLQFGQAPRGRRSGVPGWPSAPASRGPGGGVATEDARRSERLTGNRRARRPRPGNAGVEGGLPIGLPIGGYHYGTIPRRAPGRKPGSGALASRAARSRGEESPILSSRGQKKRFFADSGPKHTILRAIGSPYANNRQKRPFPTSETAKNRLF